MPVPILSFDGIPFPGVACGCLPPDTDGEVGVTQYVQMVNRGLQVFNKNTGVSVLGPVDISTLWGGFGGVCENNGDGDPVVLYDQVANRWVVSQFAGASVPTDECIAVSTSSDATGTFNRYGFHLGTNFFDYPHLGVWPDAYYMSMNVFNTAGTAFLGPQPFAFNRAAMLAGSAATFITTGITGGPNEDTYLPSDLDGSALPPAGAPNSFVEFPGGGTYKIWHFHADFITPASSSFTLFAAPAAAPFTQLCQTTRNCVPQLGTTVRLDAIGDRLMFRLAYRNFGAHESVVGNYTVSSSGVAGVRWFELRGVTGGPATVFQESTYQPDTTWRWMGSAAMDGSGNMALGFSASSGLINPAIRYAGRLGTDPLNSLAQGEATLLAGTGSQTHSSGRWGDYSDLTIDPQDDCTFWYTTEYYATISSASWRTRIGNFKYPFPACTPGTPAAVVDMTKVADAAMVSAGTQIGFTVTLRNVGGGTATGLSITDNLPAGPAIDWSIDAANTDAGWSVSGSPPSESLAYAPTTLAANASTHVHVVSATTSPSCGPYPNTASFTTGNAGSGSASTSETVGTPVISFSQSFDGVTPPALPAGWTAANAVGSPPLWVTSSSGTPAPPADSAPNAAFIDDPSLVSDKRLDSPSIPVQNANAQLTFRQNYGLENGFDGGVLEISIGGGAFADIIAAGGSFVTGGYTSTISTLFGSPIGGRPAWTGTSAGFRTTTVNLPASAASQNIQLRWRMASDSTVGVQGWRVDNITITDGLNCNPTAVTVAWVKAQPVAGGVLVRWRTTSAASFLGFEVWRRTGSDRQRLNKSLIVAKRGAHTYSYLAKRIRGGSSGAYWIRAVGLGGSGTWYGPIRTSR